MKTVRRSPKTQLADVATFQLHSSYGLLYLYLYLTAEIFIPPLSVTSGCTEHPTLRRATPLPSKQHHPKKAQSKT